MKKNKSIFVIILIFLSITNILSLHSQHKVKAIHKYNIAANTKYVYPKDTLVAQKLHWWQGLKFGLMMHWGIYSVNNLTESWTLCNEDYEWNLRIGPHGNNYYDYRLWYQNAQTQFNPVLFNPNKWVNAAQNAGMRYVVFTTKHHDGFCMFNTNSTDYCVTNPKTPFSQDPRANIALEVFNAFRNQGFGIGAYFSKPDWHSNYYWWEYFATPDRNVNYSITKYPQRWNNFKSYTFTQLDEITKNFGRMDILWLDGSWVNPGNNGQDINMSQIVSNARQNQPGMLVVNRGCGDFEDYRTPEQEIPETPPNYPWETCMTMGNWWSGIPGDNFKSANTLIHNLIEIVSKGGNYLLNIGVNGQGDWDTAAYNRLSQIADWMNINDSAIYNTKPVYPYKESNMCFTQKGDTNFVLYLVSDTQTVMPSIIKWKSLIPMSGKQIYLLGYNQPLNWQMDGNGYVNVYIPIQLQYNPPCKHAYVFRFDENVLYAPVIGDFSIPVEFKLYSNYPNPFNPKTEITFDVPKSERISITIFDVTGKEVTKLINNEYKVAGKYVIAFDGTNLTSGTYFCKMDAGNFSATTKMALIK
ncbi:MAG TPA: alpha-L-fucosidase [Ignavibacteria bacterium]